MRFGLGFVRSYSKVQDADKYSGSGSFPIVSFAYDAAFKSQVRLGVQLAFGSHKFTNDVLSLYDSTQSAVQLKENIFTLYVYGRYNILKNVNSAFRPYLMAGLGLNTSHVHSETTVNFLNNSDQVLLVKSGTRATGLGIIARVGTDYYFNPKMSAFIDAGVGASVLNVGLAINLK